MRISSNTLGHACDAVATEIQRRFLLDQSRRSGSAVFLTAPQRYNTLNRTGSRLPRGPSQRTFFVIVTWPSAAGDFVAHRDGLEGLATRPDFSRAKVVEGIIDGVCRGARPRNRGLRVSCGRFMSVTAWAAARRIVRPRLELSETDCEGFSPTWALAWHWVAGESAVLPCFLRLFTEARDSFDANWANSACDSEATESGLDRAGGRCQRLWWWW